jgi:hypothetical protein
VRDYSINALSSQPAGVSPELPAREEDPGIIVLSGDQSEHANLTPRVITRPLQKAVVISLTLLKLRSLASLTMTQIWRQFSASVQEKNLFRDANGTSC